MAARGKGLLLQGARASAVTDAFSFDRVCHAPSGPHLYAASGRGPRLSQSELFYWWQRNAPGHYFR